MNTKIALISGGLGDIGSAIAVSLGKQGVKIALGDVFEEKDIAPRLELLRLAGCAELMYTRVDVAIEPEVASWLKSVEDKWGVAQIIIPNAGIVVAGGFTDDGLSTEQVRRQFDVNYWGSYHLSVLAAKRMKRGSLPGRIVFIGSWVADRPLARISAYCVSKAAIRMLCKTLAIDLAGDNILVNEVAPGIVEGGLSKKNADKDPGLLAAQLHATPVHRLIPVEEIANHVLSLCGFSNFNLTGTVLLVDGGLSLTSKMTP